MRAVEVPRLARYAAEWDELVAGMAVPSPFLRAWWLAAVDEGAGAFVLVLDDDRLVGGLPLVKRSFPGMSVYRFAGQGTLCPDHLDVVARPEQLAAVTDVLAAWAARPGNRLFDLAGVSELSRIASWLPAARRYELDSAPCQPLPASADDYLAARPRSFRKTVRRTRNRLDEIGASVRHADPAGIAAALDAFDHLHHQRGDRADLLAELPRLRRALTSGVSTGEAWVDVLETADRVLAVSVAFCAAGRVSLYQTARDQDGAADNASTILNLGAIERAIAAGCTEMDMLRGEEPYKRHYADGVRRLFRVRGASGLVARVVLAGILAARRGRDLLLRVPLRRGRD